MKTPLEEVPILAIDAGVGPETAVTGAPAAGVSVGVTLVAGNMVEPLLTVMVTVIFKPEYWQLGDTAILATNELTESMPDVALIEVTVPPFWAIAVKEIVPLSVSTVL